MKKKAIVLVTTYIISAFLIMGGFIYKNGQAAEKYSRYVNNSYQHAFSELVNGVGEIDTALQKSLYASTPSMISAVCTDVFGKASGAQMSLGELPFYSYDLEATASFISKVGDYAYMLSKSAAYGNGYTEEQYKNLSALSDSASLLSQNLNDMLADINSGALTLSEMEESASTLSYVDEASVNTSLGSSFKMMESEFPEIPSLIYDGPFSEHITQMEAKMLENSSPVSKEQAISASADMTDMVKDTLAYSGKREGELPVYVITGKANGGDVITEVTCTGGIVTEIINTRQISKANISADDAVRLAERYLQEHGYDSMQTSYHMTEDNKTTVNFAYNQDGITYYPDLVKVTVALDNGSIVGFESKGYIMSHFDRDTPSAAVDEGTAAGTVSDKLKILSHNMAVIPTAGKNEVFCHEFKCRDSEGKHLIVYINAETGREEKILILLEDENGTLTI